MAYQADHQLEALGDPTRRAIFERIARGPLAVGAIARDLPVSRPAVSQHLKVLMTAHLVSCQAAGTRRIYHLDRHGLAALRRYLDRFWGDALESYQSHVEQALAEAAIPKRRTPHPPSRNDKP